MKRKSIAIVLPLVAAASIAVVPAATAQSESTSTQDTAAACVYEAKKALYLRARKTNHSTGLTWIARGERFRGPCGEVENGQRLGDCQPGGLTDKLWAKGRSDGHTGWVFFRCVRTIV
jgi:hypothetical protein